MLNAVEAKITRIGGILQTIHRHCSSLRELGADSGSIRARISISLGALLVSCLWLLVGAIPAGAHAGHEHPGFSSDGRLPGQPDFEKVGNTTYRYIPSKREYELRAPGQPVAFMHGDPVAGGSAAHEEVGAVAAATSLPILELQPICRTWGHRIAVVYAHHPTDSTPTPKGTLRNIVRRMNWKVNSQASIGGRNLRMAVDCNSQGEINVYDVPVSGVSFPEVSQAVANIGGSSETPEHLVFHHANPPGYAGIGSTVYDNQKSRANGNASFGSTAIIYNGYWGTHTPIHELFHNLGATQGAFNPKAPYSTMGSHCVDGVDTMCYEDGSGSDWGFYSETRCPASEYSSSFALPLDCGHDTYFNGGPTSGSYLASFWNVAGIEDPYLAVPTTTLPSPNTGVATLLKSQPGLLVEANLNGSVVPNGDYSQYWFEWGPTTSYGVKTAVSDAGWGTGPNSFSRKITSGMAREATYHFRIVAKNEVGTVNGQDRTLITSFAPEATTGEASEITPTSAVLNGVVNPKGAKTSYKFEYGPTAAYGSSVPVTFQFVGEETKGVAVSQKISNLISGNGYHYRLVATSAGGTVAGADRIVTAKDLPPVFLTSFGSSGGGQGQFNGPRGIASDSLGNLWVADGSNDRVQKFNSNGEYLGQFGSGGTGNGQFDIPTDVGVDSSGNLWITDGLNGRVQKFNSNGEYLSQFGSGNFIEASGVAIDTGGDLWVTDHRGDSLRKFNTKGELLATATGGPGLEAPAGVAIDPQGDVWVADMRGNRVLEYSSTGQYKTSFGSWGSENGQFMEPGIIDFGAGGNLWVGDRYTGRVQEFAQTGEYLTQFGGGKLNEPGGLFVTSGGAIYVSNSLYTNRVEKWVETASPTVLTQAASSVTANGVTLNGTVNPGGLQTSYRFEYGQTTAYGSNVPLPDGAAGSGNEAVAVKQSLEGLSAETTYHYRIVATNAKGTSKGADKTFFTSSPLTSFQANDGFLWVYSPTIGANNTALGMKAGTSPSGTRLVDGSYRAVFQDNQGNLWTYSLSSASGTGLGMLAGTSPSIAPQPAGGYVAAFQSNAGVLWSYSSATGSKNTGFAMKAGTSPAIAVLPDGSTRIAYQGTNNELRIFSSTTGQSTSTGLGMLSGTSPAIVPTSAGGYVAAFQSNAGVLWSYSSATGSKNTGFAMKAGTSPSLSNLSDGSQAVAFHATNDEMWVYFSATGGKTATGLGMLGGTSPSITTVPGGYEAAVQAGNGMLRIYNSAKGTWQETGLGMMAGTGPNVAN